MYKIIGWLFIVISVYVLGSSLINIINAPAGVVGEVLPSRIPSLIFMAIMLYVGYRLVKKKKVKMG